jgi:DNA polymerase III delta prime subunit
MNIENLLLTEKFRPRKLKDLIVPDRVMKKLEKGVEQHLLLYSSPGTGKTSTAKVMVKEFDLPHLYINASVDTSVDIIRSKIIDFCSNRSLLGNDEDKFKIVILDEIDGVSDQFFKALRATMDKFKNNTRFIATCNYINKIPEPIQSRFELINFDFSKDEEKEIMKKYIIRLYGICKTLGVEADKEALLELVKRKFPDLRSMLNSIQAYISEEIEHITVKDIKKFNSIYKDVYNLIFNETDPAKNYKYLVTEYSNRVDDVLSSLGNEFIEYIKMEQPSATKNIPQIIIEVHKYQAERQFVIDPILPLLACVFSLQEIVKN